MVRVDGRFSKLAAQLVECVAYPSPGFDVNAQIKQLTAYVTAKNKDLDNQNTIALRDDYIAHRIALTDLEYGKFLTRITGVKNGLDAGKDIAVGTMGAVGGLVGGGTAQILSTATAATTAANGSINTVYFYNQTLPAIVSAMNSGRKAVLATIIGICATAMRIVLDPILGSTDF